MCVLVDIERGVGSMDEMLFEMLEESQKQFMVHSISEEKVVLTKADRVKNVTIQSSLEEAAKKVNKYAFCYSIIHATSAKYIRIY